MIPCTYCGDPAPGQVWQRVDVDHEVPARCPVCDGEGETDAPRHENTLNDSPAYAIQRREAHTERKTRNHVVIGLSRGAK